MLFGTRSLHRAMLFQQSHTPGGACGAEPPCCPRPLTLTSLRLPAAPARLHFSQTRQGLGDFPESSCRRPGSRQSPAPSQRGREAPRANLRHGEGRGGLWGQAAHVGACAIGTRCPLSPGKGILTERLLSPNRAFSKPFLTTCEAGGGRAPEARSKRN